MPASCVSKRSGGRDHSFFVRLRKTSPQIQCRESLTTCRRASELGRNGSSSTRATGTNRPMPTYSGTPQRRSSGLLRCDWPAIGAFPRRSCGASRGLPRRTKTACWRSGMSTLTLASSPTAVEVRISDDTLTVTLADGRVVSVPISWYPRLSHALPQHRSIWEFIGRNWTRTSVWRICCLDSHLERAPGRSHDGDNGIGRN
jgi:hypothetical protein